MSPAEQALAALLVWLRSRHEAGIDRSEYNRATYDLAQAAITYQASEEGAERGEAGMRCGGAEIARP